MEIKISTYDFFNKFILGLVFTGVVIFAYRQDLTSAIEVFQAIKENTIVITVFSISALAIVYEIGIIINRLGSILEDLLRKTHIIPFIDDYKRFNEKKKEFPIMNVLSREYALSRNSVVLFLLISILTFIRFGWFGLIPLAIMLMFYYSCWKYAKKIVDLVK
jgi:hypothetical protein